MPNRLCSKTRQLKLREVERPAQSSVKSQSDPQLFSHDWRAVWKACSLPLSKANGKLGPLRCQKGKSLWCLNSIQATMSLSDLRDALSLTLLSLGQHFQRSVGLQHCYFLEYSKSMNCWERSVGVLSWVLVRVCAFTLQLKNGFSENPQIPLLSCSPVRPEHLPRGITEVVSGYHKAPEEESEACCFQAQPALNHQGCS